MDRFFLWLNEGKEFKAKEADIWAMAVTIYYIATEKLPFTSNNQTDLKEEIVNFQFNRQDIQDPLLADLLGGLFQLNPERRSTLRELMRHKWVTNNGAEPLCQLSEVKAMEITEKDMQAAIKRSKIMTNIGIAVKLKLKLNKSRNKISKQTSEVHK